MVSSNSEKLAEWQRMEEGKGVGWNVYFFTVIANLLNSYNHFIYFSSFESYKAFLSKD
jgi:hypothetical protein